MRMIFLVVLTIIAAKGYPQSDKSLTRRGNDKYNKGSYQQAELEYRKALEKNPKSYRADYNLGNALYREKQYDAAGAKYAGLAEKEKNKQKRSRYYYNLGNTLYESKKYNESAEAYKNALRNNPNDKDAKHNLLLAMQMLKEQQNKQKQDQQQNKNDKNDKNKQDQNKQKDQQNKDKQQNQQGQNQQQNQQDKNEQAGQQPQKGQISPQDAERILQALENEEKDVMKKAQEQKEKVRKVQLEKNW
jgi:Ca-activated chloride channel homolog